jgi:hypothetical protein
MLVVASEIDSSSERIINYLSDTYGVTINAMTFQYLRDEGGREYVARVFLIEPSEVEYKAQTRATSKRKPPLTYDELQAIAERRGVGQLYKRLVDRLSTSFDYRSPTRSNVAFSGIIDGSRLTVFGLRPGFSDPDRGVRFYYYVDRFLRYFGVQREDMNAILPSSFTIGEAWKEGPSVLYGYFKDDREVDEFLAGLAEFKGGIK